LRRLVDGDRDDLDALRPEPFDGVVEAWQLVFAGRTPGGPDIEQDDLVAELEQADRLSVAERLQVQIVHGAADDRLARQRLGVG
jgi:hypothetical protein